MKEGGRSGDLAVVFDKNRRFVAIGLYDPDSPIQIRILHQGKPTKIDGDFWRLRLREAREIRRALDSNSTGWRWVNGENDGLPGLVVDWYDGTVVIKLDSTAWMPHLDPVIEAIMEVAEAEIAPVTAMVLRLSRTVAETVPVGPEELRDGSVLHGEVDGDVPFLERGLFVSADVLQGQKTGYFLDQRANRARVRELAKDQDVLDVFCCTGGFTLAAGAGGATAVHSIDRSAHAMASMERHIESNRSVLGSCRFSSTTGDAFAELEQCVEDGRRYGIVIIDPPSFARSIKDVGAARRAYRRLTELAVPLVASGGWLVQASCTSRVAAHDFDADVRSTIIESGRRIVDVNLTGHDIDHPVTFSEGSYLKCVFARLA